jgi:hypothetical protein
MGALNEGKRVSAAALVVHDVEHLMQEVNSGASFEQYFRWSSLDEIGRIREQLRVVGLSRILELTERAIQLAFPEGIPTTEEEKRNATEWTPEQEERLASLLDDLEEQNGHVTNVLGEYARTNGL